jgi:TatD DNase family protein
MTAPFDAHSHLPRGAFPVPDQPRVLCGTCEADWEAVLAHAASHEQVIPMLGLHPWFVAEASAAWAARLETLLRSHRAGVGECGLDFARKEADRATQESAFRAQLRLAHALHRPVAMHAVRAWGRLLDLLREEGVPKAGAMVHAYGGSAETALVLESMGVFLSFSGELLKEDRPKLKEALRVVASSHLLLETDGTADLAQVLAVAAGIRGVSVQDLMAQTWENGQRCFKELLT